MPQTSDNHDIYLSQIHQLKQLQKVDDLIFEENMILAQAPKELQHLQDRLTHVEQERNRVQEKLTHLREQEIRLKRETEEDGELLRKGKDKLMISSNEREYNAGIREIDNIERRVQPREDERVILLDEKKTQTARFEEIDKEYVDLRAQVETGKVNLDEKLKKTNNRLKELANDRKHCIQDIPKPIFQRYEFIRERLQHPVIVALRDSICPSCHIAIPPQTYNDLLRGGQILSCPNCQRLIVSYDHYIADDPEAQALAAAEREQQASRPQHKKTTLGRSALFERDYKDDKDDVDFGATTDELDDDLHMGNSIECDLNNMSRMADVSDLADMSETTGLSDLGGDADDGDKGD